jgi:hypothetical protein
MRSARCTLKRIWALARRGSRTGRSRRATCLTFASASSRRCAGPWHAPAHAPPDTACRLRRCGNFRRSDAAAAHIPRTRVVMHAPSRSFVAQSSVAACRNVNAPRPKSTSLRHVAATTRAACLYRRKHFQRALRAPWKRHLAPATASSAASDAALVVIKSDSSPLPWPSHCWAADGGFTQRTEDAATGLRRARGLAERARLHQRALALRASSAASQARALAQLTRQRSADACTDTA